MSLVPTSVSVVSCLNEGLIHGCTISSLVSVDVREENSEIVFVLKKQSLVGEKIKINGAFTINVLSADQVDQAKKYSAERLPERISSSSWIIESKFAEMPKSRIVLNCELLKIYEGHAADIFVGKVIKHSGDQSQPALIYNSRKYGRFQST